MSGNSWLAIFLVKENKEIINFIPGLDRRLALLFKTIVFVYLFFIQLPVQPITQLKGNLYRDGPYRPVALTCKYPRKRSKILVSLVRSQLISQKQKGLFHNEKGRFLVRPAWAQTIGCKSGINRLICNFFKSIDYRICNFHMVIIESNN